MKINYRTIYIFCLLLVNIFNIYSQQTLTITNSSQLNTNLSPNCTTTARDVIYIKPGTDILPSSNGCTSNTIKLDENLICPVNYIELSDYVDPNTRILDLTLPVGTIEGSGFVTNVGGAEYTIPIYCPPGTNGAKPKISITYNSQNGMGSLGLGWNLNAISSITRIGQNYFCDENVTAVNLDQSDYFSLDGNRLEVKSGAYGQSGAVYTTRAEEFYKITALSYGSNGQYFKVITKEGVIMEYGNTDDSRVEAYDKDGMDIGQVLEWRLNKVTDQNGNYILYNYNYYTPDQTNLLKGESCIKSITYTGNDAQGITPYNTINFFWESRYADDNTLFFSGAKVPDRLILRSIKVETEGSIIKKYDFDYINNFNTCLYKITENASDGTSYNSTLIKWGTTTTPISNAITSVNDDFSNGGNDWHDSFKTITGDFNGDGISDVIIAFKDNTIAEASLRMYSGTPTGGFILQNNATTTIGNFIDMIAADYNNDGKDEIIIEQLVPTTPATTFVFELYFNNGFLLNDQFFNFPETPPLTMQSADFFGDGKNEIIFQDDRGIVVETIGGSVPLSAFGSIPVFSFQNNNYYNFDYNGNGKQDILTMSGSSVMVYEYQLNPTTMTYSFNQICNDPESNFLTNNIVFPGDYNCDGKTDLLYYNKTAASGNHWWICYSTGKTINNSGFDWANQSQVYGLPDDIPNTAPTFYNYIVSDVNGDGKSDIISVNQNTSTNGCSTGISATLNVYLSKGEKSDHSTLFENISQQVCLNYQTAVQPNCIFLGEFNGDGNTDILWRWTSNNFHTYYVNQDGENNLVTSIVDGLNKYTHFDYSTLAKGDCYTKGGNAVFPVNDVQSAIHIVKSMETPNISTSTFVTDYTYENAKYHRQGLGFMGFEVTTSTGKGSYSKLKTINTNDLHLSPGFFYVLPASTEVYNVNNQLIGKSIYTNTSLYIYNNGIKNLSIFPFTSQIDNYDYLSSTKNIQSFSYNIDGNLLSSDKTYYNGTGSVSYIEDIITSNTYSQIGSNAWLPNYITSQGVSTLRAGQPTETRYTTYSYDQDNCNMLSTITDPGMPKRVAITYTYNNCGLVISKLTQSPGLDDILNSFEYDSKYRFCTKTTNALLQYSTNTYEPAFGNIISQTDINGITTTNTYDAFGNLIKTHTPEGNINYSLGWATGNVPPTAVYYSNEIIDNAPDVQTYYDVLEREVYTITDGFNQKIYTLTQYDINGAVLNKSKPFFSGYLNNWTEYTYDNISDRVVTSTYHNLSTALTTTYAYNGGTATITDPAGQTSSKTIDAAGRLVLAQDNGGTITYTYTSSGNIKTITSGGVTTTIGYDYYDRQNSLSDPNTGNSVYEYNAYGQLITQTDAKNNVYHMTYDKLGRIHTKTCSTDADYLYTYDIEPNGKGKIASIITTPNSINSCSSSQNFKYDALGRNYQLIETVSGTNFTANSFTTNYSFDSYGNITQIVYPGTEGYTINETYDNFGNLIEITQASDNKSIWKLDAMDNMSNITQYETADKTITTNKTYDPNYNLLSEIQTGSIFDYTFTFDPATGNLTTRSGNNRNTPLLSEAFTYDNLERLKTSTSGLTTNYYTNGNIQNKSDASANDYIYSSTHPNAVEAIVETGSGNISSLTQNTDYNAFNKISHIGEETNTADLYFYYGVNQQRKVMQTYNNNTLTKTKYYSDNYEKEIIGNNTREWFYIAGGDGLAAIFIVDNGTGGTLHWVAKDHLGSIMGLYNQNGTKEEEFSYDAWGRRRNPYNWSYTFISSTLISRGYTGHEHLDQNELINMNGRLYDPVLGRMLSPDNFVQNATSSQGFNRYSYCNNNPLKYTDPSGESLEGIARGIIDFLTFPGRILADATDWLNNKINNIKEPNGYYFNLNYISGGMHPAGYGNYNDIIDNSNFDFRSDLSDEERVWTDYRWQEDYANYWFYDCKPSQPNPVNSQQNNGAAPPVNAPDDPNKLHNYDVPEIPGLTIKDYYAIQNWIDPNTKEIYGGACIEVMYNTQVLNLSWYQNKCWGDAECFGNNAKTYTEDCSKCPTYGPDTDTGISIGFQDCASHQFSAHYILQLTDNNNNVFFTITWGYTYNGGNAFLDKLTVK